MLVVAIVPAVRRLDARDEVMRAVAKRFGIGSLVALAVLLGTGAALASHLARWSDEVLQAELMLLVLIGVLTALHVVTPYTRAVSIAVVFDFARDRVAGRRADPLIGRAHDREASRIARQRCAGSGGFGSEDDLTGDTACLGVAQRGGIGEREAAGDLGGDRPPRRGGPARRRGGDAAGLDASRMTLGRIRLYSAVRVI
jgi:hypothetical protein